MPNAKIEHFCGNCGGNCREGKVNRCYNLNNKLPETKTTVLAAITLLWPNLLKTISASEVKLCRSCTYFLKAVYNSTKKFVDKTINGSIFRKLVDNSPVTVSAQNAGPLSTLVEGPGSIQGGTPKMDQVETGTRYYRLVAPKGSKQVTTVTQTANVKKRAATTGTKFAPHCVNCCVRFTERNRKRPVSAYPVFRNGKILLVQITEALEYIFGVSLVDFNNYLLFTKKDEFRLSATNIVLCTRCVSELQKLYEVFKAFDKSDYVRSILKKSINWKKEQLKYKVQQMAVYRPENEECLLNGISEDEEENVEMDGKFPVNDFLEVANKSSRTIVDDHNYTNTSRITGTKRRKQNLSDKTYEEQLEFNESITREDPVTSVEVVEIQNDFETSQFADEGQKDELCPATDSSASKRLSPSFSSKNCLPFETCVPAVVTSKEEIPHKCLKCGKTFKSDRDLKKHKKIHLENLNTCSECVIGFPTQSALIEHTLSVHSLQSGLPIVDVKSNEHSVSIRNIRSLEKENQQSQNMNSVTIENVDESLDSSVASDLHGAKETPENVDKIELPLCPVCKESFDSLPEFRIHVFNHRENKDDAGSCTVCENRFFSFEQIFEHKCRKRELYSCRHCQLNLYSLYSYGKHAIKHKAKFCPICKKSFTNLYCLKSHEQLHARKPFSCIECGLMFQNLQKLKAHKSKHDEVHTCTICGITFKQKFKLYLHEKSKHLVSIPCTMCAKTFKSAPKLALHMKSHNSLVKIKTRKKQQRQHKCNFCEYAFIVRSELKKHIMTTHTGEMPFTCSYCNMKFVRKLHLLRHEKNIHSSRNYYPCKDCDERFQTAEKLNRHKWTRHDAPVPFTCKFCDKRFNRITYARNHERTHRANGEKPFACSYCDAKFALKKYARQHEKIHTRLKNYLCTECDEHFQTAEKFNCHKRTHTGLPAPFACKFCDKRFDRIRYVKEHERTHSKEKPFLCSQCGKCFTHKTSLNTHERLHGNKETHFSCSVCDKKFTTSIGLTMHKTIVRHWH